MENKEQKYFVKNKKAPPHELAAGVNEIVNVVGKKEPYTYVYWLVKAKNVPYSKILEICKKASLLEKDSRGGFITNSLRKCG